MQFDMHNQELKKVGKLELPDGLFAAPVRKALLWEQVQALRATKRRGTVATKDRAAVAGTGAKPHRQKGSGRARQGGIRSPINVGGGVAMGPRPRDWGYRLPRSARKAALSSALSVRVRDKDLLVLDKFELDQPKTKAVVAFLEQLGTASALLVDIDNGTLKLATRNLEKSKYLECAGINVYDILKYEKLVLTKSAVDVLTQRSEASSGGQP